MTTKEQAKKIWDTFELPPNDFTCADSLEHSKIVIDKIAEFIEDIKLDLKEDVYEHLVDYWIDVKDEVKNIYKFRRY